MDVELCWTMLFDARNFGRFKQSLVSRAWRPWKLEIDCDHASANNPGEAFAFGKIHDVEAKNQDKEGIFLDQH